MSTQPPKPTEASHRLAVLEGLASAAEHEFETAIEHHRGRLREIREQIGEVQSALERGDL